MNTRPVTPNDIERLVSLQTEDKWDSGQFCHYLASKIPVYTNGVVNEENGEVVGGLLWGYDEDNQRVTIEKVIGIPYLKENVIYLIKLLGTDNGFEIRYVCREKFAPQVPDLMGRLGFKTKVKRNYFHNPSEDGILCYKRVNNEVLN